MEHLYTFEHFLFEQELNEIGEANATPYRYQGPNAKAILSDLDATYQKVKGNGVWSDDKKLIWTFKGDKGSYKVEIKYSVKSAPTFSLKRKSSAMPKRQRAITGNIGFFEESGKDSERTTNFGEQFKVLATVTAIAVDFMNAVIDVYKIDDIYIIPKADQGEIQTTDNRRGRFYEAYIKKQIRKVKKPVSVEANNTLKSNSGQPAGGFVITDGHRSSTSTEYITNA
jgi:hypothetical protein